MGKRKLKVFRVQPQAYEKFAETFKDSINKSDEIRHLIAKACDNPPADYPVRKIKADLVAFSLFLDESEHEKLVKMCEAQGVSKNIFLEAMFNTV